MEVLGKRIVPLISINGVADLNVNTRRIVAFSRKDRFDVLICKSKVEDTSIICKSISKEDAALTVVWDENDEKKKHRPTFQSFIEPWMLDWITNEKLEVLPDKPEPAKGGLINIDASTAVVWGSAAALTAASCIPYAGPLKVATEILPTEIKTGLQAARLRKLRDQILAMGETYEFNGEVATVVKLLDDVTVLKDLDLRLRYLHNASLLDKKLKIVNLSQAEALKISGSFFIGVENNQLQVAHNICKDIETMFASHPYDFDSFNEGNVPHLAPFAWPDTHKNKIKLTYQTYLRRVDLATLMKIKREMSRRATYLPTLHGAKIILDKAD